MNACRRFKEPQMFLAKTKKFAFITPHTAPQNGECNHVLAQIPVRDPYRGCLQYRRMFSRISSICLGAMFIPPLIINSFERPTTKK